MLHIQEVRSQGTLGGVRVMSALLALLLLLDGRCQVTNSVTHELGSGALKVGEKVAMSAFSGGLTEEQVGLTNVIGSERAEQLKNGGQTTDSLDES